MFGTFGLLKGGIDDAGAFRAAEEIMKLVNASPD